MPKYRVTFYYHASATYDVEAADKESAFDEGRRLSTLESADEFRDRLILDVTDFTVEEDKED